MCFDMVVGADQENTDFVELSGSAVQTHWVL